MLNTSRPTRSLAIMLGVVALAACQSFTTPLPPQPRTPSSPPAPQTPAPQPEPEPPPPPIQPQVKKFRLSAASNSLVTQARGQVKSGNTVAAAATLERALRIEPNNPLLWIELGRLRLSEKNAAQADSMGRKAVALATGDPNTQAAAWRLIAESLRARGRKKEAVEAEERASILLVAPLAYDDVVPVAPDDEALSPFEEADEGFGGVGIEDAGDSVVI